MTEIWPIWQHNWIFILAMDRILSHTHQHVFLEPAVGIKTTIAILKDPNANQCFQFFVFLVVLCFGFRKEIFFKGYLKTPNDSFFFISKFWELITLLVYTVCFSLGFWFTFIRFWFQWESSFMTHNFIFLENLVVLKKGCWV